MLDTSFVFPAECTVIILRGMEEAVLNVVEKYHLKIQLNFHVIEPGDESGPLDSLRSLKPQIKVRIMSSLTKT